MAHDDRTPTNDNAPTTALVHAKEVDDFKTPEGQPDPRGWRVKSTDGTTLGQVEDLLVETGEARVRYLEVRTERDLSNHGGREYFLLPIGTARLDEERDDVVVNMTAEALIGVPAYAREQLSREYETSLRDHVRQQPDARRDAGGAMGRTMDHTMDHVMGGTLPTGLGVGSARSEREVSFYNSPEYDDAAFFSRGRSRTAVKPDDLKLRVEGNRASRPGPDPTDRRF